MSAYMLWLNASRERIKAENPGISITEISKKAGEMWKQIDKDNKEVTWPSLLLFYSLLFLSRNLLLCHFCLYRSRKCSFSHRACELSAIFCIIFNVINVCLLPFPISPPIQSPSYSLSRFSATGVGGQSGGGEEGLWESHEGVQREWWWIPWHFQKVGSLLCPGSDWMCWSTKGSQARCLTVGITFCPQGTLKVLFVAFVAKKCFNTTITWLRRYGEICVYILCTHSSDWYYI